MEIQSGKLKVKVVVCVGGSVVGLPGGLSVADRPHVNHLDVRHSVPQASDRIRFSSE